MDRSLAARQTTPLAEFVDKNSNLPSLPGVAVQVLERACRPSCGSREIVKSILLDPALCERILRLINSVLIGFSRPVTSIEHAVQLLGIDRIKSIVIGISLTQLKTRNVKSEGLQSYWRSSVTQAVVAREAARMANMPDPNSELVAGLLCDLGSLMLQVACPDQYRRVLAHPQEILAASVCEIEKKTFGFSHSDVSWAILKRWKMPDEYSVPIRHHHSPEVLAKASHEVRQRAKLLHFADRVAQLQLSTDQAMVPGQIAHYARESLGLTDESLNKFLEKLGPQIEAFAKAADVDIGEVLAFDQRFAVATERLAALAMSASLASYRINLEHQRTKRSYEEAEEKLRFTEEQLAQLQKMEVMGRLTSGVAHDYNNLLTVIIGYCELADISEGSVAEKGYFGQIRDAAERAAALTRQLLAFCRQTRSEKKITNINDQVTSLQRLLRHLAGRDVRFETRLTPDPTFVRIDPTQLEQILMNLVANARDAMGASGSIRISTELISGEAAARRHQQLSATNSHVILAVQDSGSGIEPNLISKVFEPFFSTKPHGSGIGLSTIRDIVQASNGAIELASKPGEGATFSVYLPTCEGFAEISPQTAIKSPLARNGEAILLVDEDPHVLDVSRENLEKRGFRVLVANSGAAAVAMAATLDGDLALIVADVLVDCDPAGSFVEAIRAKRGNVPVLYLTAWAHELTVERGFLMGGQPFLLKPYSPSELVHLVVSLLKTENVAGAKGGIRESAR